MLRLILSPVKTTNFKVTAAQLATQGDYQGAVSNVYTSMGEKVKAE